ncbi:MAG: Hsp20 family protein [Hyphomicrobiales bacterium]
MSRVSVFSSPFLLGFDEIERMLESAAKSAGDGYPPYNIERVAEADGSEHLRIVLAVAGFSADELDITVEDNQVIIHGKQHDDNSGEFLHRGIAARQFKRAFVLAEGMEVTGADLENGLLSIELLRRAPERVIRKIEISRPEQDGGKVR